MSSFRSRRYVAIIRRGSFVRVEGYGSSLKSIADQRELVWSKLPQNKRVQFIAIDRFTTKVFCFVSTAGTWFRMKQIR